MPRFWALELGEIFMDGHSGKVERERRRQTWRSLPPIENTQIIAMRWFFPDVQIAKRHGEEVARGWTLGGHQESWLQKRVLHASVRPFCPTTVVLFV